MINDEQSILDGIGEINFLADHVTWAVDVTGTMSGLLLALLAAHGQQVKYAPGRVVNQMATAYRGEAKTDARDAYVIAETARHRGDLVDVAVSSELVMELRLLVTHRAGLIADQMRIVNRLRDVLSGYFPALEREFDLAHSRGAAVLLTGYQTPAAIRRIGAARPSSVTGLPELGVREVRFRARYPSSAALETYFVSQGPVAVPMMIVSSSAPSK